MEKDKMIKFFNYPKYYSKTDYQKTINKIAKNYLSSASSIYTFGGKITPGISDIDVIIVMKGDVKISLNLRLFLLDKKSRYIVSHPFFFISENYMKDVKIIYPYANFQFIIGKNIEIIDIEEKKFYELVASIDMVLRHFPRDYVTPLAKSKINVRDILLRLKSLTISFDAIERIGGKTRKDWRDFKSAVEDLRKYWFKLRNRNQVLMELTKRAIVVSIEVTEEFNRLLKKDISVDGKKAIYHGFQNKAVFIRDWDKEKALNWINKNKNYQLLPLEFSALLFEYSKYNGPISGYIKRNLKGNIYYEIENKNLIEKRIEILNNQALLANRLKHSHFTAFVDFGYKSNSGVINKAFNLIRKIKYRNI